MRTHIATLSLTSSCNWLDDALGLGNLEKDKEQVNRGVQRAAMHMILPVAVLAGIK